MKPESYAWQRLHDRAEAQLRPDFADSVLAAVHATPAERTAWQKLHAHAAAELRPGFAARVIQAAREAAAPSFSSQFMLGAATAAGCLLGVIFIHQNSTNSESARNLADWQELASEVQELEVDL